MHWQPALPVHMKSERDKKLLAQELPQSSVSHDNEFNLRRLTWKSNAGSTDAYPLFLFPCVPVCVSLTYSSSRLSCLSCLTCLCPCALSSYIIIYISPCEMGKVESSGDKKIHIQNNSFQHLNRSVNHAHEYFTRIYTHAFSSPPHMQDDTVEEEEEGRRRRGGETQEEETRAA